MRINKSTIIILFFIIAIELVAYLVLPNNKLGTLDSILQVIEENQALFWRQRPHLNIEFQGVRVSTNSLGFRGKDVSVGKDKQTYRIICLGASPTFGWGVNFQNTYPSLLEQKFKGIYPDKDIEVINAGQIGYSSYQGSILLEKYLLGFSPDLITVPYVLNDIDRYRFYGNKGVSDKELVLNNPFEIAINNTIPKIRFFIFMKEILSKFINKDERFAAGIFKKQCNLAKVRVSGDDYRENLVKIINIAKANNIKLIFIKMPINLSLPHLTDSENGILKDGKTLSKFYYDQANKYEKMRDYHNASIFFKKAKDYQVIECARDGVGYHKIMEEKSCEYHVPLVDADRIFKLEGEGKSKSLFNSPHDPVHPNPEGHRIICEALYNEITSLIDSQR
ncbi:MAG: GDSL-type esterase/lipase family protein [Candidatus Omnitrophica bacterium]|jgi:lysophospholipase L1-like esterase|nr:GDSL-type esterase/lipase family protein [Candidatus Omnitrophota bacterium]